MINEYIIIKKLIEWLKYSSRNNYDFIMCHKKWERVLVRQDNPMDLSIKFSLCDCAGNEYYNIIFSNKEVMDFSNYFY